MYLLDDLPPDEEQTQTLHLYIYKDEPKKPLIPVPVRDTIGISFIFMVLLGSILAVCLLPVKPAYAVRTVYVPLKLLPIVTFQSSAVIHPTDKHVHPATWARGAVTIYNGSILTQELPAGFLVTTASGLEISLMSSVVIPTANPPSYGIATVAASALKSGVTGNIAAYQLNAVYGSSLYLKNLAAFSGGSDMYTTITASTGDAQKALQTAQAQLMTQRTKHAGILQSPCHEQVTRKGLSLRVSWRCQFVTYVRPAGGTIVSVHLAGNQVRLQVRNTFMNHPVILPVK